ncbi:hypothetical protein [Rathayibacter toxicus]|uniref:hypothetical protein n=1 Tax=Rathayibacter toxicus TaxID=145458 RepID=UPI000CE75C2B|nr:hypothetical protein [Rathayibacter toxicus]PPI56725.1 hypothetical protein C5D35_00255 [Rathayibacter toxicus]QOD10515.1 hypothetical protein BSG36_00445 [Rathayibacter toxicus]QWL27251.1 hypothetical protein E2R33_00440 [Rathayibacter toxicus]QWL31468.1 hypothetical protein E2R35_00420 [Rathayibacter toxicus]QWL33559.1 hypothetical protein E2R36_00420 [Rathayibacter toxicus]
MIALHHPGPRGLASDTDARTAQRPPGGAAVCGDKSSHQFSGWSLAGNQLHRIWPFSATEGNSDAFTTAVERESAA